MAIGDTIIDQYHYCVPMGKSSKEPIVANRYISDESFAGGSLATANNLASVCGSVDLLTVLGKQNSFEEFITERLSPNIVPQFFYREDVGTIVKRRYVTHNASRKLFEICYIDDGDMPHALQVGICDYLERSISDYDLVVVNDFGHGLLTRKIINFLADQSNYLAVNFRRGFFSETSGSGGEVTNVSRPLPIGATPVALRAPSIAPMGETLSWLLSGDFSCIVFMKIPLTRPTLIFQGVGVSLTLAQRVHQPFDWTPSPMLFTAVESLG